MKTTVVVRENTLIENAHNLFVSYIFMMAQLLSPADCSILSMFTYTNLSMQFKVFDQSDTLKYSVW